MATTTKLTVNADDGGDNDGDTAVHGDEWRRRERGMWWGQ